MIGSKVGASAPTTASTLALIYAHERRPSTDTRQAQQEALDRIEHERVLCGCGFDDIER